MFISKRVVASAVWCVFISTTSVFGSFANADVGEVEVGRLLDSMSRALREQNYRGTFTYEYGGMLETLKLTHQVNNNREYEKIEHLDGAQRMHHRQGIKPECKTIAEQVLRLSSTGGSAPNQYYHYYLRNVERVADRQVQVVQLLPKDQYRYGHIISIDQESSLPLVNLIVSPQRRVLERIQFTNINVSDTPEDISLFAVKMAEAGVVDNDDCATASANDFAWMINWLPPGFVLAQNNDHSDVGESLSYTDGLASFSVFVKPNSALINQAGVAQKGASIALLRPLIIGSESFQVSVVGEIPGYTADKVASSIGLKVVPSSTVDSR